MFNLEDNEIEVAHQDKCKHISEVVDEYLEQLQYEYQNQEDTGKYRFFEEKPLLGVSTGLKELDAITGGLINGEVVLVATNYWKCGCDFLMNCTYNIANQFLKKSSEERKSVLYFNLRKNSSTILFNLIKLYDEKQHIKTFDDNLGYTLDYITFEKIAHTAKEISKLPISICDSFLVGNSIDEIKKEITQYIIKQEIKLVVIDSLQDIGYNINDYSKVIECLKEIAECYNISILVLSFAKHNTLPCIRQYLKNLSNIDSIFFLHYNYWDIKREEPKKRKNEKKETFDKRYKEWERVCDEAENECMIDVLDKKTILDGLDSTFCFCYYDVNSGEFDDRCPSKVNTADGNIPF